MINFSGFYDFGNFLRLLAIVFTWDGEVIEGEVIKVGVIEGGDY